MISAFSFASPFSAFMHVSIAGSVSVSALSALRWITTTIPIIIASFLPREMQCCDIASSGCRVFHGDAARRCPWEMTGSDRILSEKLRHNPNPPECSDPTGHVVRFVGANICTMISLMQLEMLHGYGDILFPRVKNLLLNLSVPRTSVPVDKNTNRKYNQSNASWRERWVSIR